MRLADHSYPFTNFLPPRFPRPLPYTKTMVQKLNRIRPNMLYSRGWNSLINESFRRWNFLVDHDPPRKKAKNLIASLLLSYAKTLKDHHQSREK